MESFPFQAEVFRHIKCYDLKCISNQNFLFGMEVKQEPKIKFSHLALKKLALPPIVNTIFYYEHATTIQELRAVDHSKQLDHTR